MGGATFSWTWCWLAAALLLAATEASAETTGVEEGARRSLTKSRLPWYDADRDDVRLVRVRTNKSEAHLRDSTWVRRERIADTNPTRRRGMSAGFWQFMQIALWGLLGAILAFVVALAVWAFIRKEEASGQSPADIFVQDDSARIENLPFQVRKPKADFLAEARRHYEAGNYGEAIIYLFSYQLVQLDKSHVIHLAKGKTNRQYLRETRERAPLRRIFEGTMLAFEDVFFGHYELDKQRFESCWAQLDEFHQDIQQQGAK